MNDVSVSLSQVFLFDSLTPEQSRLVAGFCSLKRVARGEEIFHEGQKASAFFGVVEGKVKIYKLSPDGAEQILKVQEPGDLVAEAAIFDIQTYPAYCQAMEDSVLLRIPKVDFVQLVMKHPEIGLKIINAYSKRLRHFVSLVEDLTMRDIKTRLARYLLNNAVLEEGKKTLVMNMSKKELASVLGTIPETLSRTLGYFKKQNMIEESGDRVIIRNESGLKTFV